MSVVNLFQEEVNIILQREVNFFQGEIDLLQGEVDLSQGEVDLFQGKVLFFQDEVSFFEGWEIVKRPKVKYSQLRFWLDNVDSRLVITNYQTLIKSNFNGLKFEVLKNQKVRGNDLIMNGIRMDL